MAVNMVAKVVASARRYHNVVKMHCSEDYSTGSHTQRERDTNRHTSSKLVTSHDSKLLGELHILYIKEMAFLELLVAV